MYANQDNSPASRQGKGVSDLEQLIDDHKFHEALAKIDAMREAVVTFSAGDMLADEEAKKVFNKYVKLLLDL